jgi:methylenetetrahydrofolate dehydrogenase (NADP+)/methenyltetrahydrofolate cyclohydrolase
VVGEGKLVGKPVAAILREQGYDVSIISLEQGSLTELKDADIVISGAGSPHLIKPEMLKPGVV